MDKGHRSGREKEKGRQKQARRERIREMRKGRVREEDIGGRTVENGE